MNHPNDNKTKAFRKQYTFAMDTVARIIEKHGLTVGRAALEKKVAVIKNNHRTAQQGDISQDFVDAFEGCLAGYRAAFAMLDKAEASPVA